jgi:hypothetical protein
MNKRLGKEMEIRQLSMPYSQNCPLKKTYMSKGRLQQIDIPLEEEVNKDENDFNNFEEEDLGIQDSKEEAVKTPLEEVNNKLLLLEKKKRRL